MSTSSKLHPPLAAVNHGGAGSTSSSWTPVTITTIIIASVVIVSASIYLLLGRLFNRCRRAAADDVVLRNDAVPSPQRHAELLDSLPLFTFRSVTRNVNGGDCAVCLSNFKPNHQLRLLPLCCHAFHAECIDSWIVSNPTCPLCRSTVRASDCAALDKILSDQNRNYNNNSSNGIGNQTSGSFRIELGSISRRGGGPAVADSAEGGRRTYSLGSVDFVVDDCVHEVSAECTMQNRGISDMSSNNKDSAIAIRETGDPVENSGRNWLREYLASISSRTMSFRSSNRFFSGSSRRSEAAVVPEEDLEVNRAGEEISEVLPLSTKFMHTCLIRPSTKFMHTPKMEKILTISTTQSPPSQSPPFIPLKSQQNTQKLTFS